MPFDNFDYAGAKKAGYSDDEIQSYLKDKYDFDFDLVGARKSGYNDSEIADYFSKYNLTPRQQNAPVKTYTDQSIKLSDTPVNQNQPQQNTNVNFNQLNAQHGKVNAGTEQNNVVNYGENIGQDKIDLRNQAIDNTLQRKYKNTGITVAKNSPKYKKDFQKTLNSLNNGDIVQTRNTKTGEPTTTRGAGFLESTGNALIESFKAPVEAWKINTLSGKELADYLDQKRSKETDVPESLPSGFLGNLGEAAGGFPKVAGLFALNEVAPGLGTTAASAEAQFSSTGKQTEQLYHQQLDELTKQGIPYEKARLIAADNAKKNAPLVAAPDAAMTAMLGEMGADTKALSESADNFKTTLLKSGKSVAKMGLLGGGSEAGRSAIEKAQGYDVKMQDVLDNFGKGAFQWATLDGMFKIAPIIKSLPSAVRTAWKDYMSNVPAQIRVNGLDAETNKDITDYSTAKQIVPDNYSDEQRSVLAELIQKKNELSNNTNEHFKTGNEKQVETLDKAIKFIQDGGDASKVHVDDITGEISANPKEYNGITTQEKESIDVPKEYGKSETEQVGSGEEKKFKPTAYFNETKDGRTLKQPIETGDKTYTDKSQAQEVADKALKKHYYENGMHDFEKPQRKSSNATTETQPAEEKENIIQQQGVEGNQQSNEPIAAEEKGIAETEPIETPQEPNEKVVSSDKNEKDLNENKDNSIVGKNNSDNIESPFREGSNSDIRFKRMVKDFVGKPIHPVLQKVLDYFHDDSGGINYFDVPKSLERLNKYFGSIENPEISEALKAINEIVTKSSGKISDATEILDKTIPHSSEWKEALDLVYRGRHDVRRLNTKLMEKFVEKLQEVTKHSKELQDDYDQYLRYQEKGYFKTEKQKDNSVVDKKQETISKVDYYNGAEIGSKELEYKRKKEVEANGATFDFKVVKVDGIPYNLIRRHPEGWRGKGGATYQITDPFGNNVQGFYNTNKKHNISIPDNVKSLKEFSDRFKTLAEDGDFVIRDSYYNEHLKTEKQKDNSIVDDNVHAQNIKDKFRQQFKAKGVSDEHIDGAIALMDARAKSAVSNGEVKSAEEWYKKIADVKGGEFQNETPKQYQLPDGRSVMGMNSPEVVNGFYSPLEKTIGETKFDKLPVKQWIDKFATGEEAKWTGLNDWLKQQSGNVSKADIQKFLRDNRISVVEVVKDAEGNENDEANGVRKEGAKYHQYQLEGDKSNYKEVLVTMPKSKTAEEKLFSDEFNKLKNIPFRDRTEAQKERMFQLEMKIGESKLNQKDFKSSHFDEPNILVHLRMNTRKDAEGNKVLFLEEVQSDWGQKGKKEGFKLSSEETTPMDAEYRALVHKNYEARQSGKEPNPKDVERATQLEEALQRADNSKTPKAPFVTNTPDWTKLGLKVALKEAVKQGADKIAWTTGEQQNERYDLSKSVDRIVVSKVSDYDKDRNLDYSKRIVIHPKDGSQIKIAINSKGRVIESPSDMHGKQLEDVVGKEMAEKIMAVKEGNLKEFSGLDLKIGGKGMKGFYGEPSEGKLGIVGEVAKKLFKQEPKETNIESGELGSLTKITDENGKVLWEGKGDKDFIDSKAAELEEKINGAVEVHRARDKQTQHSIDITPELKKQAEQGQPLFQKDAAGKPKGALETLKDGRVIIHALDSPDFSTMVHEIAHVFEKDLTEAEKKIMGDSETFARGFERYLRDGKAPTEQLKTLFDKFKDWLTNIYKSLKGSPIEKKVSPELKQVFDRLLTEKTETKKDSIVGNDNNSIEGDKESKVNSKVIRVMGEDAVIDKSLSDSDGVLHELYRTEKGVGLVRMKDIDSGEVISLKKFPSFEQAEKEYQKNTKFSEPIKQQAENGNISSNNADENFINNPIKHLENKLPIAKDIVDGRKVRDKIPNTSSIEASLGDNYESLSGIREVPFSEFPNMGELGNTEQRVKKLAQQIKESGEINPLIVVYDNDGAYILEGAHRFDALRELGAKSFPAKVVVDTESINKAKEAQQKTTENQQPQQEKVTPSENATLPKESGDTPMTGIKHESTEEKRKEFGLGEYERNNATDEELQAKADEAIKGGYNVEKLIQKLEDKIPPTGVENFILKKYLAGLEADFRKTKSEKTLAEAQRVYDALDKIGSLQSEAFRTRKGLEPTDDTMLGFFNNEKAANNDAPLTENQKKVATEDFNKFQEAKAQFEKDRQAFEDDVAKFKAEQELAKAKKETASKSTKKKHDDLVKEREQIFTDIKDKLRKARGQASATIIPYANELIAIAPDVLKLAKNLVADGIVKLQDVVENIHKQLDDDKISEKDVRDMIAGVYNEKKPTRKEAAIQYENLKHQARLINNLELALKGEPKTEKAKIKKNQDVEKFKKDLGIDKLQQLESLANRNKTESEKIREKIKKGDFAVEEKKQPLLDDKELAKRFPERFKAAQKSRDELIKAKHDIAIRRAKQMYENRTDQQKTFEVISKSLNIPRTLMTIGDFSAVFRQAAVATVDHPIIASKALKFMFEAAADEKVYNRWLDDVHNDPLWADAEKSKLPITDPSSLRTKEHEEAYYGSQYAEQIPGVGQVVKFSERAYNGYLNFIRWEMFKMYADEFSSKGKTYDNNPELYKGIASFIGSATGRGGMRFGESASPVLNAVLFASRLIAARVNMLGLTDIPNAIAQAARYTVKGATLGAYDPHWGIDFGFYSKLPKEIRGRAALSMVKTVGVGIATLVLAKQMGAQVELDPRSSDFGKVHDGNTRWDIWGGFQPYARLIAQIISGQSKSANTGKVYDLDGSKFGSRTIGDQIVTFGRGKFSPILGTAADILTRRTLDQQTLDRRFDVPFYSKDNSPQGHITLTDELLKGFTPLLINDIKDAMQDRGVSALFTVGIPSLFGIGTQTYQPKPLKGGAEKPSVNHYIKPTIKTSDHTIKKKKG